MRGEDKKQSSMLMLMSPETRVPQTHPLRPIKTLADEALAKLSPVFDAMYAEGGRPSIPPERLLKSMLLIALYSVRSERQFCEQLDYNLLFRWFLAERDRPKPTFLLRAPAVTDRNTTESPRRERGCCSPPWSCFRGSHMLPRPST
jgi:hypothetical protein